MSVETLDTKAIELLRDIPDIIPVLRRYYETWTIKVFNRETHSCKSYLSPNRRDFYKILFITKGVGVFTLGMNTYYIDEPTILFLHPNEIISWKNLAEESAGHYCLFKRNFIADHPVLKSAIDKYELFSDNHKSVIRMSPQTVATIEELFRRMHEEALIGGDLAEDSLGAYMQLIMIAAAKTANYPKPDAVSDEFKHIHDFFRLLEKETSLINHDNPIRIKTAQEFADNLAVHPNHLNVLLKKHTGQNVSAHIKHRLLEESKALLLQTDWTLQDIGYAIGFADQPNFSQFFKKNAGITPAEFRRGYSLS
ncbi:helix-turn-helix domain-containing protein [Mucilaginibacter calamicampi]|uniref:Helix-turn-helix domain-containing protein n=1 Tax=Mucilaginibacter calamicampi TaxID=1302352 RepID=A0ABW2Z1J0_9SPHI